ncbi:MAG: class I SAM-dependent methyltransferase [Pseudomonadota bacterium]
MGLWERYVVPTLVSCACASPPIMKQRQKVVPLAEGDVLEFGCGSGTNFGLYNPTAIKSLHALEPAPGMVARARKKLTKTELGDRTTFLETGAEAVPLEDKSVDTVVITFVLCTIPDWRAALSEARRVLRPGGKILFSEHGLAPDENVAKWQRRIEPVWKPLAGGCHLTRDILALMREGGFQVDTPQSMYLPGGPKFAGFVSWGAARAA